MAVEEEKEEEKEEEEMRDETSAAHAPYPVAAGKAGLGAPDAEERRRAPLFLYNEQIAPTRD